MLSIEFILLGTSSLVLLSIVASKASGTLGIPALLVFLAIGMLVGSDGPGGIHFDDPWTAQSLGVIALSYILFEGGIETKWSTIREVIWKGLSLSTIGSVVTATLIGFFVSFIMGWSLLQGFLVGAIVSSTDAAAVFAVLRTSNVSLKGRQTAIVELESGSNDPMAVFLTAATITLLNEPGHSMLGLVPEFVMEMSIGLGAGYFMGRAIVSIINNMRLHHEGLYPVLTLALVLMTYALTAVLHGNGFLAVYVAALVVGNSNFFHRRTLIRFHSGLAWLMQIAMFVTLGLLVYPKSLVPVIWEGLTVALVLVFVVRPIAVFASLAFTHLSWQEKLMIAWMGLKGAVPIVLATFPLLAGVDGAPVIFHLIFFIVLTSVLLQGPTIPFVAKLLKVGTDATARERHALEYGPPININSELTEVMVPFDSHMIGKSIMDLRLPEDASVMLISREEGTIVPTGRTPIEAGDVLMVLATKEVASKLQEVLMPVKTG